MASADEWCGVHGKPKAVCKPYHEQAAIDLQRDMEKIGDQGLPDMGASGEAITMHQIMLDYMEAGFTRPEAVYIVTAISLGHPGTAPTYDAANQAAGEQS